MSTIEQFIENHWSEKEKKSVSSFFAVQRLLPFFYHGKYDGKKCVDGVLFDLDLVGFISSSDRFWILSECWVNPWRWLPMPIEWNSMWRKKKSPSKLMGKSIINRLFDCYPNVCVYFAF